MNIFASKTVVNEKSNSKISKRKAFHMEANLNELYIKNKSNQSIYIKKIHKLFDSKFSFIFFLNNFFLV